MTMTTTKHGTLATFGEILSKWPRLSGAELFPRMANLSITKRNRREELLWKDHPNIDEMEMTTPSPSPDPDDKDMDGSKSDLAHRPEIERKKS